MVNLNLSSSLEEIFTSNTSWGNDHHGREAQALVTAKLAQAIKEASASADRLNDRMLVLNIVVAILGVIQAWPIVASWFTK